MNHNPSPQSPRIHCPNQRDRHRRGDAASYRPPHLRRHGCLGPLIRGTTWKGVDAVGELPEESGYPG